MQRVIVLRELRKLIFPQDFDVTRLGAQHSIIKMLVANNPKDRPSCSELLSSTLLPPKYEESQIAEAFRAIVNPDSAYYNRLIKAIYEQPSHAPQDFAFDFNSTNSLAMEKGNLIVFNQLVRRMRSLLEARGAIDIAAPLLIPRAAGMGLNCVELLDSSGVVVCLPQNLTFPFARYVGRINSNFQQIKRYHINQVFRKSVAGGQPRSITECDFDIISKARLESSDCEAVATAIDILNLFPSIGKEFVIIVNHTDILESVLNQVKIPFETRSNILALLEQERTLRVDSLLRLGIEKDSAEKLITFDIKGDFASTCSKLLQQGLDIDSAFEEIQSLLVNLERLKLSNPVVFAPLLSYHSQYYRGGIIFQIGIAKAQKLGKFKLINKKSLRPGVDTILY